MASERRLVGAILGAVVAGAGLTALTMAGERRSGKPSELVELERAGAKRIGVATPPAGRLPSAGEQATAQGGHLLLSAAAGAVYAATTDEEAGVVSSGIVFGLGFYLAAHWVLGPLLKLKQPEWRAGGGAIGMHALNHVAFGLATAAGATLADRSR